LYINPLNPNHQQDIPMRQQAANIRMPNQTKIVQRPPF
jgi:hypothetical protein